VENVPSLAGCNPLAARQSEVNASVRDELLLHLTTLITVVILSNMSAKLMLSERRIISEMSFVEMVVWRVPTPLVGSCHYFKYRLALVEQDICILRYDNEAGKGDHRHAGDEEVPYLFTSPRSLLNDFWRDVENWRNRNE